MDVLTAIHLIVLHTVEGREVPVNPRAVTHLITSKQSEEGKHFVNGVHCMVNFIDGKFVAVVESCDQVQQMIEEASK